MFDDSDMKIVGEPAKAEPAPVSTEELTLAQQNGNLEKAKQFGALLAQRVLARSEQSADVIPAHYAHQRIAHERAFQSGAGNVRKFNGVHQKRVHAP